MKLKIVLHSAGKPLVLPLHYNEWLQGLLYHHLETQISTKVHDEGFPDPNNTKRRFKLFCFSRLLGKWRRERHKIVFYGPITWWVTSVWDEFLTSLAEALLIKKLKLNGQSLVVREVEVLPLPRYQRPILVEALSPITVYHTFETSKGKKKTHYYSPFERDFEALILKNLARKVRTWSEKEVEPRGHVKPFRVSPRDEHVIRYKGTVIKAWTGVYELDLSPELFEMAFDAGLGAKNSQGFGCITLWEGGKHNVNAGRDSRAR